MVAYPFEGRLAHQTLGMLLTRRLERAGARPLGFVASDYALAIWGLGDIGAHDPHRRACRSTSCSTRTCWATTSRPGWPTAALLKRTFRNCAIIAGLIERRHPGQEKTGRQVTVSSDLIYDVLRSTSPTTSCSRRRAPMRPRGLLDVARLGDMLARIKGQIVHKPLDRISPLAVPIMLEIGKERVDGEADEALLAEAADD